MSFINCCIFLTKDDPLPLRRSSLAPDELFELAECVRGDMI